MCTRKGLLVGVTLDACDGNGMVPRWDTPSGRVLGTTDGHHVVVCVLWILKPEGCVPEA